MVKGMICLACGEQGRTSDFIPAIVGLAKPKGTLLMKASQLGPAVSFNAIARAALKMGCEWLFLVNDDNLWPEDTLIRLLAREVDVVGGYYLTRVMPFLPVAFGSVEILNGKRRYHRFFPVQGQSGLAPIVATGDGCLLVRRRVMEALQDPWWEYGDTLSDRCDHDMVFCRKIREAGFDIWLDLDIFVDHVSSIIVRPWRDENGTWSVRLVQAKGREISMPPASMDMIHEVE